VPVVALGVSEILSEVAVTVAVKVIVCAPAVPVTSRESNVATPSTVLSEVVPPKLPGPEFFVAVTVKLSARLFAAVIGLENLSCKVTTGGGLNAVFIKASTVLFGGTSLKTTLLATPYSGVMLSTVRGVKSESVWV
jgi:hypothetical protein